MKKKIFLTILLIAVVSIFTVNAYAGLMDEIINQGNNFNNGNEIINQGSNMPELGKRISKFITGEVIPVVSAIGNLVFAAITVILGAKYIWSSADSRASVMESLPTFVAAVLFFYLGESVVGWLSGAAGEFNNGDWTTISGKILGTINTIVHYASFGGILFLGLKYMFASAEGKSQMKMNSGALVLGMTFVFMASKVVDFIIDIGEGVI